MPFITGALLWTVEFKLDVVIFIFFGRSHSSFSEKGVWTGPRRYSYQVIILIYNQLVVILGGVWLEIEIVALICGHCFEVLWSAKLIWRYWVGHVRTDIGHIVAWLDVEIGEILVIFLLLFVAISIIWILWRLFFRRLCWQ